MLNEFVSLNVINHAGGMDDNLKHIFLIYQKVKTLKKTFILLLPSVKFKTLYKIKRTFESFPQSQVYGVRVRHSHFRLHVLFRCGCIRTLLPFAFRYIST